MFLCIKHVLEVGAEPGLPVVPVGSASPAVPARVGVAVGGCAVSPWGWRCCRSAGLAPEPPFLSAGLWLPPWVCWCSSARSVPGLVSQQRVSGHRGLTPLALLLVARICRKAGKQPLE